METAFIEAKQLKLAIDRVPQNTPITLTVLVKSRTVAFYQDNPISVSGIEALETFIKSLSPILSDIGADFTYQSKNCLNISGKEHTSWNFQMIITFPNITSVSALLSLKAYHQVLTHFYAGANKYDTVVSY